MRRRSIISWIVSNLVMLGVVGVLVAAGAATSAAQSPGDQLPGADPGTPSSPAPSPGPPPTDPGVPPPTDPGVAPPADPGVAPPADPGVRPPPKKGERNRGVMASLSFGASGCTDDMCRYLDPLVYLRVQGLFRIVKYFAAGLHMAFNFFDPDAEPGVDITSFQFFIGPEVRGLFPIGKVDIWTAIAMGYIRHVTEAKDGGESASSWVHGFGFGWGLGAQYHVIPMLAVGADFWLYKPVFTRACIDSSWGRACGDVEDQDGVGITWAVGVTATFWFGM